MNFSIKENIQVYDGHSQKPVSVQAWVGVSKTKNTGVYEFQPGYIFTGDLSLPQNKSLHTFDLEEGLPEKAHQELTRFFTTLPDAFMNVVVNFDADLQQKIELVDLILVDNLDS